MNKGCFNLIVASSGFPYIVIGIAASADAASGDAGPAGSLAPWLAGSAILDSTVSRTGAHGAHGSSETHRVRFNMLVASLRFLSHGACIQRHVVFVCCVFFASWVTSWAWHWPAAAVVRLKACGQFDVFHVVSSLPHANI